MIMNAVLACLALFALLAGVALVWARGLVKRQGAETSSKDERERYIALATFAANDESGRALLTLLRALDVADEECPVAITWLYHTPTKGKAGMLVKISWDGNEWRRIFEVAPLRERLQGWLAAEPALDGAHAQRLLADLAAAGA